jgi:hypothetical protein
LRPRIIADDGVQDRVDLGLDEGLRDPLRHSRSSDLLARIRVEQPLRRAEAVERAHGDETARDRRGRETAFAVGDRQAAEVVDVLRHRRLADRVRIVDTRRAQEPLVTAQIAAVRDQRVGGQAALDREPHLVLREHRTELVGAAHGRTR